MNTRLDATYRRFLCGVFLILAMGAACAQPTPPCPVGGFPTVSCPIFTDAVIVTNVGSRLLGSVTTSETPVTVRVCGGVVTLIGQVADQRRWELATLLASSVRGVTRVNNLLTIGGITATDVQLVGMVRNQISRLAFDDSQVRVFANSGVIELRGMVDSDLARDVIGGVASGVVGVTAVHNNLIVRDIAGNNLM